MEKFAVNYNSLETNLEPTPQIYRFEDVKHRLRKVAYDVVRFVDGDDISGLWQIKETESGDVIVAQYDDSSNFSDTEKTANVKSDWRAIADNAGEYVNIFYKSSPVTKVSLASVGIPREDVDVVCRYLPEKLATNKTLLSNLLSEMPKANFDELVKMYPELSNAGIL